MPVTPTIQTASFCDFLQTISWIKLTPARLAVVQAVQLAAEQQTAVSDLMWTNFLLSTERWYRYWEINVQFNPTAYFDADSVAYFNAVTTPFSAARQLLINELVLSLKSTGNWTKLDRLWLFASEAQDQAKVSLVNPASTKITEVNSPTWTADQGYTTGATNRYLNSNFTPSTDSILWTQNSATFGLYSRSNADDGNGDIGAEGLAGAGSSYLYCKLTGGNMYAQVNDANAVSTPIAVADSLGLFSAQRTLAASFTYWKRDSNIGTHTEVSTAVTTKPLFIGNISNNGSPFGSTARQYAMAYGGAGSIDISALYNSIQTFLTAIGANV